MNRPGVAPQSLRGLPNGFSNQQPLGQSRNPPSRLANGKMAPSTGSTWAFGGVPMGTAGLPGQRQGNAPMASFAQSIGGTQPAAPLDMSEFPSLSNNPAHQISNSSQSTWAMPSVRPLGQQTTHRPQQGLLASQQQTQAQQQTQQQQDELFSSSSQLPASQGGFRYGGQNPVGRLSQSQENTADEFPPLNRNANGEIGQDRSVGLLQNGISSSNRPSDPAHQGSTAGLDKETIGFGRPSQAESADLSNVRGQPVGPLVTIEPKTMTYPQGGGPQDRSQANGLEVDSVPEHTEETSLMVQDPLPGMSDRDRYGLKGLFAMLKGPYPDQAALITGVDVTTLGFDLNTTERLSEAIWSPWDDAPARPDIPQFTLPDCYQVLNVQPVEAKLSNFSDETLMFMFYNNPQDVQQMIAAQELNNRSWRYHKKLQLWLTKDELMQPINLGTGVERGYYIFFDPKLWIRERREMVLNYVDLEAAPGAPGVPPMS